MPTKWRRLHIGVSSMRNLVVTVEFCLIVIAFSLVFAPISTWVKLTLVVNSAVAISAATEPRMTRTIELSAFIGFLCFMPLLFAAGFEIVFFSMTDRLPTCLVFFAYICIGTFVRLMPNYTVMAMPLLVVVCICGISFGSIIWQPLVCGLGASFFGAMMVVVLQKRKEIVWEKPVWLFACTRPL
jgi:hypothetical protein